jgi:acetylornithine deacetylase/succinyl-diaminopimelate desuccinylase-like protein
MSVRLSSLTAGPRQVGWVEQERGPPFGLRRLQGSVGLADASAVRLESLTYEIFLETSAMTETTRLLRDLVSLPSVNPMRSDIPADIVLEHRVTAYLEQFFRTLGVPYERQTVAPGRDNIFARLDIPGARRTLILEAHQDTVPVDGMIVPPFGAEIEGNKLFGRGSCDIKGGMAAMLACFARLVKEKPPGCGNVIMACSVDEENTMLGVRALVKRVRADFAVVAEPTNLNIVHAHKGVVRWNVFTTGRSCHSSAPEKGINAIYRMGRLLVGIEQYASHLCRTTNDPLLGPATLSIGRIEGGTSVNTVPDRCRIEVDRRVIGGEKPADAPGQFLAFLRDQGGIDFPLEMTEPWIREPALSPQGSEEIQKLLGAAIDAQRGSHKVHAVPYGTDAATISWSGIPAVVFGPGDIAKAHTIDEWVPLDEVESASQILFRLACSMG